MTEEEQLQLELDAIYNDRVRTLKDALGSNVDVRVGMVSAKEILDQLTLEQETLRKKIEADLRRAQLLRRLAFVCLGIGVFLIVMQVIVLIAY